MGALAVLAAPASLHAQPAPPPEPPPAPQPGDTPGSPAPPGAAAGVAVDDAMLAPLPAAARELGSWSEAVALLSSRATELRIATYEVERAEGAAAEALGRALPTLTATGTAIHHLIRNEVQSFDLATGTVTQTTIPTTPVATGTLTASVPIFDLRIWYAIDTADRAVDSVRQRVGDAERRILGAAAGALLAVVTAEKVGEVNRSGLRLALERLELQRRRAKFDVGKRIDLLRNEQDVARARASVLAGDEALRRAREALGQALGASEPYGVSSGVSVAEVERMLARACAPIGASDRPDVLAARADLEVAERGVTDAELMFAPRADLSTTGTVSSDVLGSNRLHGSWSVQAVLTWPIYDGGVRYGTLRRVRALRDEQQARLDGVERAAGVEAAQASRGVAVAAEQRSYAAAQRELAREAAELSARAYEAGDATSFELIESARQARDAELALALREYEVVQARIAAVLTSASCHFE
ncbi:MAG: TolC family protein [Myxococcales bacterium]|nr:TolC family protein [Myxococcales bacterium]